MAQRFVMIDLDRPRRMRFNTNAMDQFETVSGGTTVQAALQDLGKMQIGTIKRLLWASLLWDDNSLSRNPAAGLEKVGNLIDEAMGDTFLDRMKYVVTKIGESVMVSFGIDPSLAEKKMEEIRKELGTGDAPGASPSDLLASLRASSGNSPQQN